MKKLTTSIACFMLGTQCFAQPASTAVLKYVDPFIGVNGGGNVHPAATLPYSVISLGPDVEYVQSPSGNGYTPNRKMIGFSHARTSGTGGGGRYGNFAVLPQVGSINLYNKAFVVKDEFASPGFYTCLIDSSNIHVALTLSNHVGFHQDRFKEGDTASILLDVSATRLTKEKSICTEAYVEIISNKMVRGYAKYKGGWGGDNPYIAYFYAAFDQAAFAKGTCNNGTISNGNLSDSNFIYNWQIATFETRTFNKNMYLHPFPQTEVLKGNLTQNPGW